MPFALKALHNISRPGETPTEGDIVEVECVGGFVKAVDPVTRTTREQNQQFRLDSEGRLETVKRRQGVHIAKIDMSGWRRQG